MQRIPACHRPPRTESISVPEWTLSLPCQENVKSGSMSLGVLRGISEPALPQRKRTEWENFPARQDVTPNDRSALQLHASLVEISQRNTHDHKASFAIRRCCEFLRFYYRACASLGLAFQEFSISGARM